MNLRYAKRSEDTEQINVTSWAAWNERQYPELKWLHHIPNGGSRNKAEAVKLKQMGVKAGVSDLCLPYPKRNLLRIVHRDEVRRRKAPEVAERVPDRYGSSRTLRRNLLHIRGRGERVERVLRVIISAVDERAEQQRLERRYDFTTEEKVRTGTWTNMQQ